jgi:hypothetical protein
MMMHIKQTLPNLIIKKFIKWLKSTCNGTKSLHAIEHNTIQGN